MRFLTSRLQMFYYVYILQSINSKKLYIGFTKNLKERMLAHNSGKSLATKPYIPYRLIYYEAFPQEKDAKQREIYLKTGYGLRTVKKILKNFFLDQGLPL